MQVLKAKDIERKKKEFTLKYRKVNYYKIY